MTLRKLSDKYKDDNVGSSAKDESTDATAGEQQLFGKKSDEKLWDLLKNGSHASLIALYNRHFNRLLNYGYQFTKDTSLIEDAIQDLFVDLNIKRRELPGIKSSVKSYLLKATKFKILQYLRKEDRNREAHEQSGFFEFRHVFSIEHNIISKQVEEEQKDRLKKATMVLTSRQREALYYFYNEQMSYEHIKEIMGLRNVKSARNLLYKAISHLRKVF